MLKKLKLSLIFLLDYVSRELYRITPSEMDYGELLQATIPAW